MCVGVDGGRGQGGLRYGATLQGVVEARIEGGVHLVRLLWKQHAQEEDWGFLLIDVCNAFNEDNFTSMMWAVRHKWPSGARFVFN